MTNAIEALEELDTCHESIWAYDIANVNTRPSNEAYTQAFPFAFGLLLYKSFDKAAKTGIVSMPDQSEQGRTEHGRFDLDFYKNQLITG